MRKSILLVDDNAKIRELLSQFIDSEPGLRVCGQAIDGRDAIEKAQRLKPDLIILDQAMPVMTGVESARVLSKIMPHVPLLLFTLHSEEVAEHAARAAGIHAVVTKTEGLQRLIRHAQTLLGNV